jgi:predicted unusual protein kinase regulating ubiquinone biosynthesis (AarF/ABC1/UbiB family)
VGRLLVVVWQLSGLALVLVVQGGSEDAAVQRRLGRRLLNTLTSLGPCFIKLGQALSTRPDLVRRDWLDQLTRLQDDLPAFDHNRALATIAEDLGSPAEHLFASFPDHPVAAASLGQVYKAQMLDGRWVAVKVQRPNLEPQLKLDLAVVRLLAIIAGPFLPLNLGDDLTAIVDEFGNTLFREIDYELEADNAERFAQLFENDPTIIVPAVERSLSSHRVLTTTWLAGVKLQNSQQLRRNSLDPTTLVKAGVISGLRQLLEFGYFHADPHPGNLFAMAGGPDGYGCLGYVDFGMMDMLSNDDRLTLTDAVVHLINKDFRALAQDFVRLGFLQPGIDLDPLVPALEDVLGGQLGESVGEFNFKTITDRFSELMFEYPFRVPARFALIIRAVVSQEGLALRLDPEFSIIRVAYPYVAKRLLAADTEELRHKLLDVIFDADGRLQLQRLENLLDVVGRDGGPSDLLPVAGAGMRLMLGREGHGLRQRLLFALVRDGRLNTEDFQTLMQLLRRRFSPSRLAGDWLQVLST